MGGARAGVRDRAHPYRPPLRRAVHPGTLRGPALTLTLVAAGRTGPNRALPFGGEGGPLDDRGRRDVVALALRVPRAFSGPESSVVQSAEILADVVVVDPALRSIDLGSWSGRRPEEVAPSELGPWFADPDAVPHGGESVGAFVDRVHTCLVDLARRSVPLVVAAKPVVQAALALDRGLGAAGYFTVDVRPASTWTVDISIRG